MAYATAALPTHPYAFYFTPADYPAAARQGRLGPGGVPADHSRDRPSHRLRHHRLERIALA
jgi:hypothetical protein